jgi:hypothetical protein
MDQYWSLYGAEGREAVTGRSVVYVIEELLKDEGLDVGETTFVLLASATSARSQPEHVHTSSRDRAYCCQQS